MNKYSLEIVDNEYYRSVMYHIEDNTYVVEKDGDRWYYQSWDMGGSCLERLSDEKSNWIDKEYNRLLREKKLERICNK
jgi:hypothetical protein